MKSRLVQLLVLIALFIAGVAFFATSRNPSPSDTNNEFYIPPSP